jgi:hypothetical protein
MHKLQLSRLKAKRRVDGWVVDMSPPPIAGCVVGNAFEAGAEPNHPIVARSHPVFHNYPRFLESFNYFLRHLSQVDDISLLITQLHRSRGNLAFDRKASVVGLSAILQQPPHLPTRIQAATRFQFGAQVHYG